MSNFFDDIKAVCDFEAVARYHGIEFGRDLKSLCPFHDEQTPSFSLHSSGAYAHCFGCDKSVDVIGLECELGKHSSMYEAAQALNQRFNLGLKSNGFDKEKAEEIEKAQKILDWFCKQANETLLQSPAAQDWLTQKKGITIEDIETYCIGLIDKEGIKDRSVLKENLALSRELGLLKEKDGKTYQTFSIRLVFPVWQHGRIRSIWTRQYPDNGNNQYKWLGLPNSRFIPHKPIAFLENLNCPNCIVVEGITDAITLIKAGFPACALLGTSISAENETHFKKARAKLYFCMDPDEAGRQAAYKLVRRFGGYVAELGDKDPDELLVELGPEQFKALIQVGIEKAKYHLDAVIEREEIPEALKDIAALPMASEQERYLRVMEKIHGVSVESLKIDLNNIIHTNGKEIQSLIDSPRIGRIEIPKPGPLAEHAFYGLAGKIIGNIEPQSEAAPVALLINFLTTFGNIIGTHAYYLVGTEKHHFRLFVGAVGDTAKGRKGTSWNPIKTLFDKVEPEYLGRIQTGLSSGEGLIWHVRDEIYKMVPNKQTGAIEKTLTDEGIADKRLLIIEGELAQTLKVLSREGNTLSPVIRNAWDSGNLQTLTKGAPAKATDAHISIIGHITKSELLKGLSAIETGNGFANRFLWVYVDRSKVLPYGGDFSSINLDSLINQLKRAVDFARQAGRVVWAEETRPLWEGVYPELSEGKPGRVGAITARAEAQVVRLACLYALLDCATEITPAHLKGALAVWGYAEASVRYIFQNTDGDPLGNKILEALSSQPLGMTRTEINNLLSGNYSTTKIAEALDTLRASNLADKRKIETGGRPGEQWFLVKRVTENTEKTEKGVN